MNNLSLFLYLILFLSNNLTHIQATSILATTAPRINVVEGQESAVDKKQEEINSISGQVSSLNSSSSFFVIQTIHFTCLNEYSIDCVF